MKLPKKCRELKLDILHCTSNLAPIFTNVPHGGYRANGIIYLEGTIFLKKGFTLYQRFGNIYRKLLAPHILKKAKKIITVSYSERKRLKALPGRSPAEFRVVDNASGPTL
ncbi:MAG: hypothetical protein U5L96_03405 [Owenweeksia sp.]|nr:hypothetical protein [Owenweeksia sp.]